MSSETTASAHYSDRTGVSVNRVFFPESILSLLRIRVPMNIHNTKRKISKRAMTAPEGKGLKMIGFWFWNKHEYLFLKKL